MKLINKYYFQITKKVFSLLPITYRLRLQIKYFFAGVSATLLNLILLALFHSVLNWSLVLSTSLAFILSFLLSFALQKFWTFRNKKYRNIPRQLVLYLLNALLGLSLNVYLIQLLVNSWGIWYLLAQVIISLFLALLNFLVYNFIIFRRK